MLYKNLKKFRLQCSLTQKQMAEALSIDRSTYTYYESGKSVPTLDTLKKIASIFNVTVDRLIDYVPPSDPAEFMLHEKHPYYDSANELVPEITRLTNAEKFVLITFRMQPEEEKIKIIEFLNERYKNQDK